MDRTWTWVAALIAISVAGCQPPRFPEVVGHTDIAVTKVDIQARAGEHLEVGYQPLFELLGLRIDSRIRPGRTYNPFRLAEDRRRLVAYLHDHGRFDAEVDEPELAWASDHKSVAVTWRVHEGTEYKIKSVDLIGAPREFDATLRAMIPFAAGDEIELESYRPLRRALAERLQDEGWGHARGYSRIFVDRERKDVAWFYYIDPGPRTRIGSLKVEGNSRVPAATILARSGLGEGDVYSTTAKRRAELALLDSGAFASAIVLSDADIQTGPPEHPDTGGALASEQIDGEGRLVPRQLPDKLAVRVIVVEAPARQLRGELGLEADPARLDTFAGARVTLRDALGPQHHLVVEGFAGYGWKLSDRDNGIADGFYGSALAQYLHPGFLHRILDARITGRWRDTIYPAAMLREIVVGPGLRSTIARGVFFDIDAYYRFGRTLRPIAVDAMTSPQLALTTDRDSRGGELVSSLIADRRDDRVEPRDGWLVAATTSLAPGGALGDHRWLRVGGDARGYRPLGDKWSIGARIAASWVALAGANGVPLGPRLFGGGAHGMRGYARDELSPAACALGDPGCRRVLVGGRSLVESSIELRLLPFRKQFGAAVFVDAGGAGAAGNPFDDGLSLAVGAGGRIRLWYLPIALDVAYRMIERNTAGAALDRLLVFFRIGEAF